VYFRNFPVLHFPVVRFHRRHHTADSGCCGCCRRHAWLSSDTHTTSLLTNRYRGHSEHASVIYRSADRYRPDCDSVVGLALSKYWHPLQLKHLVLYALYCGAWSVVYVNFTCEHIVIVQARVSVMIKRECGLFCLMGPSIRTV